MPRSTWLSRGPSARWPGRGTRPRPASGRAGKAVYLAHLINTVPPGRPEAVTVAPARAASDLPLSLAALAAWIVTAAAGGYLLAGLARTRRSGAAATSGLRACRRWSSWATPGSRPPG